MMFKRILAAVMSAIIVQAMSSCGEEEVKRPAPELTEDGKKIVSVCTMYAHSETEEDIYDLISGAVEVNYNSNVINIIGEEAGAYFSGQKSSKEVAEIIQNRVQNYLDENR